MLEGQPIWKRVLFYGLGVLTLIIVFKSIPTEFTVTHKHDLDGVKVRHELSVGNLHLDHKLTNSSYSPVHVEVTSR